MKSIVKEFDSLMEETGLHVSELFNEEQGKEKYRAFRSRLENEMKEKAVMRKENKRVNEERAEKSVKLLGLYGEKKELSRKLEEMKQAIRKEELFYYGMKGAALTICEKCEKPFFRDTSLDTMMRLKNEVKVLRAKLEELEKKLEEEKERCEEAVFGVNQQRERARKAEEKLSAAEQDNKLLSDIVNSNELMKRAEEAEKKLVRAEKERDEFLEGLDRKQDQIEDLEGIISASEDLTFKLKKRLEESSKKLVEAEKSFVDEQKEHGKELVRADEAEKVEVLKAEKILVERKLEEADGKWELLLNQILCGKCWFRILKYGEKNLDWKEKIGQRDKKLEKDYLAGSIKRIEKEATEESSKKLVEAEKSFVDEQKEHGKELVRADEAEKKLSEIKELMSDASKYKTLCMLSEREEKLEKIKEILQGVK